MDERMRESEATIRALLEATPDSAALIERDGAIILVNREFARRLGKDPGELVGVNVFDLPPPDLAASRRLRIDEVVRTGRPCTFVDERSGMVFESSVYPVAGVEGEISRVAIFARDLTEQLRAEAALRASEERARRYLDLAGIMFVAIDASQRVVLINRRGCEILGYPEEEILGKNWFENFLPERMREQVPSVFASVLAGEAEAPDYFENPVLTRSGRSGSSPGTTPS